MSDPRIAALEEAVAKVRRVAMSDEEYAAAILAALPPDWCGHVPREGSRLVEVAIEVFGDWMARTKDGHALTMEWGELDERGMYTPVWTVVDDGKEMVDRATIATLRAALDGLVVAAQGLLDTRDAVGSWPDNAGWPAIGDAEAALRAALAVAEDPAPPVTSTRETP